MAERIDTVQDVERAFGLPPQAPQEGAGTQEPRRAESVQSDHAFPLSRAYEIRGVHFSTIALRPPRGHEFWEIGDVIEWQFVNLQPVRIDNLSAIRAYAERCVSVPGEATITGPAIIEALDIRDTLAVRKAVGGFFNERGEAGSP